MAGFGARLTSAVATALGAANVRREFRRFLAGAAQMPGVDLKPHEWSIRETRTSLSRSTGTRAPPPCSRARDVRHAPAPPGPSTLSKCSFGGPGAYGSVLTCGAAGAGRTSERCCTAVNATRTAATAVALSGCTDPCIEPRLVLMAGLAGSLNSGPDGLSYAQVDSLLVRQCREVAC